MTAETQTAKGPLAGTRLSRTGRVAALTAIIAISAAAITVLLLGAPQIATPFDIPWWTLIFGFYVAELSVVHLRFRRDAQSFSMSEIALVVGLYFVSPLQLIVAQLLGNCAALLVHRRQPVLKLVFNLAQFALQTAVAAAAFHAVIDHEEPLGADGWVASLVAVTVALLVGTTLISLAIRTTGGRFSRSEVAEVMLFGGIAASMNAALALVGVTLLWRDPQAAWLGFVPLVLLYLAYRAYVSQREERARIEALYNAATALHAAPNVEEALEAASSHARSMFESELVEIILFTGSRPGYSLRASAGPDDLVATTETSEDLRWWTTSSAAATANIVTPAEAKLLAVAGSERVSIEEAIAAPLIGNRGPVGGIVIANRLGDVTSFGVRDVQLLDTLARQISLYLENGRLESALTQVTHLKEKLEELVQSKDEFVAAVSHELRTPLTAVTGLALELNSRPETYGAGEGAELMRVIAEQSVELSDIVEDLLVAARAEIGTLAVKPEAVDMREQVESVVTKDGIQLVGDAVTIVDDGLSGRALVDPLRARQIIRNLLTNAERYGGDNVSIRLSRDSGFVRVGVIDDGDGVPGDDIERIFEPYQRAHNARTQPASVGLGLSVSRRLARLMGGDLLYRRVDDTTVFELVLPGA